MAEEAIWLRRTNCSSKLFKKRMIGAVFLECWGKEVVVVAPVR